MLAPLIALGGGVLGVLGAFFQEATRGSILMVFVAGPMIEEVMKPAGVYLLMAYKPEVLNKRAYTALLAALGGLSFAVIENLIYLQIYYPEHTRALVVMRYSAGLPMHNHTSIILGFGINRRLLASIKGEIPFLQGNAKYFIIPMVLHSLYNITVVILESRFGFWS
jgi:RsiW-degrading membrane proteinase PrsW (M82 family)